MAQNSDCKDLVEQKYKFYLAFENAICKDYVTEKYWDRWQLKSVPIVLKRSIYQNLAPKNSFIALDDFSSPRDLAENLKKIDKNDDLYQKFFHWRFQGYENVWNKPGYPSFGFCRLCDKLWDPNEPRKVYEDIYSWWHVDSYCDTGEFVNKLLTWS